MGEQKIAKMVAVRWPRWPPRPYMVKTFKKSSSPEPRMPSGWTFAGIIGDGRSTKIAKRIVVRWRLTFLRQGQVCFPMHLYGKNLQKSPSPKPSMPYGWIFAYIFGKRRATKIAKIMVVHWHWPFYGKVNFASLCICMGKMFRISNNFSSGASGPILLKFHMEPP